MYFKQVQLIGFKSFADKTDITFPGGVTCIVGPNGCGKSNVADAVRWVLGEQSPKAMRGSSMTDVIFNGTDKRRAQSFCEVTLVFDNADKVFDIEYDEVGFTRRLYRSGESEYLINKKPVRRKDIIDLLHGIGVGKEGYSIIGQGRIDQIMKAKPEDRRAVFEEATGIVVYRAQRMDTERNLANAENDLTIYAQRLEEAHRTLVPLEKQAEVAEKYNELYNRLKFHEINTYILKHDNAAKDKDVVNVKIAKVNEAVERWREQMDEADALYESARKTVTVSDEKLRVANENLLNYTVNVEKKSGQAKLIKEQANSLRAYNEKLVEDVADAEQAIIRLGDKKRADGEEISAINASLGDNERKGLELSVKIADFNTKIAEVEAAANEGRRSFISTMEDMSKLQASKGTLSAKREAVAERITEIKTGADEAKAQQLELRQKIEECEREEKQLSEYIETEGQILSKKTLEINDGNRQANELREKLFNCTSEISSLESTRSFYLSAKESYEGYKDSIKNLMSAAKTDKKAASQIKGVIADIVSCEQKYETAMEVAFGGAMQNVVTATTEDARDLVDFLKRIKGGIITFLPVKGLKPYYESEQIRAALKEQGAIGLANKLVKYDKYFDNVILNLLGNTLICDNISSATAIAKKYPHAFKIVTLDGDSIATGGSVTGGSRRSDKTTFFANERRIKEAEDKIAEKQTLAVELRAERKSFEDKIYALETELAALRDKFQSARERIAALNVVKQNLEASLGQLDTSIKAAENALKTAKDRLNELENEVSNSLKGEEEIAALKISANDEVERSRVIAEKMKFDRDELVEEFNALGVDTAQKRSQLDHLRTNVLSYDVERKNLENKIKLIQNEIAENEREVARLDDSAEKTALTFEEQTIVKGLRSEIERLESLKREANAQIAKIDARKVELLQSSGELQSRHAALQVELAKIDSDLNNLQERVNEEYGVDYEDCLAYKDEEYDASQASSSISKLKREINALGPINHNALDDYKDNKLRYDEMRTQKEDLEKAIVDLKSFLHDLKEEMRKQFDDGFNKINENFKVVFKELFGGGRAQLVLDYSTVDDPLDAGVIIDVYPPGKNVSSLTLLSGGEQAFVAIAILIAILKSRPMPFCILDEIEAALDDTNAAMFANYIKRLSNETQFIVITHRKPTMERADDLFGVTMEEKGVSKIVSVKLSEIETKLGKDTVTG